MTAAEPTYAFANAAEVQGRRLRALEVLLDEGTVRVLLARGVGPGWRCLEVGAGGGSIASWLCARVAPGGSVLATDLDTRFLDELVRPNLERRSHDILDDGLPEGEFDLVHVRLVLAWLTDPSVGLRHLVDALRPGGLLVAEEMDFQSVAPDPRLGERACSLFSRVVEAHNVLLAEQHAFDPFYGRRLAGELSEAGLANVETEGRASMWNGGGPGGEVWRLTISQLREALIASGRVTAGEVGEAIELCRDPQLSFLSQVTVAAWGVRPAAT